MGEARHLETEMRILNRVVRLDQKGRLIEADPGHAELLVQSRGLEGEPFLQLRKRAQYTMRVKPECQRRTGSTTTMTTTMTMATTVRATTSQKVPMACFNLNPEIYNVTASAEEYDFHPSTFVIKHNGKIKKDQRDSGLFHWEIQKGYGAQNGKHMGPRMQGTNTTTCKRNSQTNMEARHSMGNGGTLPIYHSGHRRQEKCWRKRQSKERNESTRWNKT